MADLSDKKYNAVVALVDDADKFMAALYRLDATRKEIASAGLSFADEDMVKAVKHVTAAQIATLLSNISAVLSDFETNNIDDVFNAVRP